MCGLVHDWGISIALAMELPLPCVRRNYRRYQFNMEYKHREVVATVS